MKLLIKLESGPSPGITIAGERADLIALGDRVKRCANENEEGRIRFEDAQVEGAPHEWLEFEIVKSFPKARDEQKVKAAPIRLAVVFFFVVAAAVLFLAYRGLRTF